MWLVPFGTTQPYSVKCPRRALMHCVRWRTSTSRARNTTPFACCSSSFIYRNKPHARPLRRLAHCFGISRVVLLPLHERLDIRWRYEPDRVTQFTDLSSPIVGPATRLQRYQAPRLGRQEINQFRPGDLLSEHRLPRRVSTMRLENMLRDIQTNRANRRHGRLPHVVSSTPHSGTSMPSGGVHPIGNRVWQSREGRARLAV